MVNTVQEWSKAAILLLKGPVYENDDRKTWAILLPCRDNINNYFRVIGLHVLIEEEDGYAYLEQIKDSVQTFNYQISTMSSTNGQNPFVSVFIYLNEDEGEYKEGKKNGQGKLTLHDGSVYIGSFINNKIEGEGVYKWSNQQEYKGTFKNNKMDGEGVFTWPDGRVYKGHYNNDKKNGYGEFTWPNGKIYKGFWKNGKQNGEGS